MRTLLLATLLLLSACKTAPFTKGDDAAASMTAATATVERLRNAATATKASFDPILAPDAKLRPAFGAFAESVDAYGRSIESVKRAIADVEQATLAYLKQPHSIQFGRDACMYVCDTCNNVIRRISMGSGIITTFAGTGAPGPTPDGAPIQGTPLSGPRALDVDREGNLWLVTREGNQVLKLDMLNERIQVIAGTGQKGYSGDGGPARQATFHGPKGISLDKDGNVWIADTENNAVRRINMATGTIETIAGTGERGDGPDGDASTCKLSRVHGVFADADGAVYIGDSENHKIRVLKNK